MSFLTALLAGFSTFVLAGGWLFAESFWIALTAWALVLLLPLWIIGYYWAEPEEINLPGARFIASLVMAIIIGYLLHLGGFSIHHYVFGSWWGVAWVLGYLGIGFGWSYLRLGKYMKAAMKMRSDSFGRFCDHLKGAKVQKNGRNPTEDIVYCQAFRTGQILPEDWKALTADVQSLNKEVFKLPASLLEHWEAFYKENRHNRTLKASAVNIDYDENKERIALWLFFWPSSMIRNLQTVISDLVLAFMGAIKVLYKGVFKEHDNALEIVSATSATAAVAAGTPVTS